jgi:ubiquinone/menaquinone biosynthesis C-methylase UbiE
MDHILKRIAGYISWSLEETSGKKTTSQIYDGLSHRGKYDAIIAYDTRVNVYRRALFHIPHRYTSVLDLACGTGAFISSFPQVNDLSIVGVDASRGMLSFAKKRFGKNKKIRFKKSDFMSLKFPAQSFDLITMGNAIRFIPKGGEEKFFRTISKLLTKNGTFLVIETDVFNFPLKNFFNTRFTKGSNMSIRIPKNFIHVAKPHLTLYRRKFVGIQALVFHTNAYYFRKN